MDELPRLARILARLIPAGDRESILGDLIEDAGFRDLAGARRSLWLTGECAAIAGGLSIQRARSWVVVPPVREVAAGLAVDGRGIFRSTGAAGWLMCATFLRIRRHPRPWRRGVGQQLAVGIWVTDPALQRGLPGWPSHGKAGRPQRHWNTKLLVLLVLGASCPLFVSSLSARSERFKMLELDIANSPRIHRQRYHILTQCHAESGPSCRGT